MERILVVEDDYDINDLITMNLRVCGYECDAVYDGGNALTAIDKRIYRLALLDVMLPEKDGFELITYMQARDIPVIFVSARTEAADRIKGLRLGAEDYIIKPFDITELMLRVEKVIARRKFNSPTYTVCGVTIDEDGHTATIGNNIIELTPIEFTLMITLARHQGIVLTRELLLDAVWGDTSIGETRTVDVHIASLRKKLHWNEAIQTVHRIGYRLRRESAV